MAGFSLQQRLEQARRRQFVGRVSERDRLRATLSEPELPFSVLYVFGPGGIGKTTLLREYSYIAHELGVQSARLDGRPERPTTSASGGSVSAWPRAARKKSGAASMWRPSS